MQLIISVVIGFIAFGLQSQNIESRKIDIGGHALKFNIIG